MSGKRAPPPERHARSSKRKQHHLQSNATHLHRVYGSKLQSDANNRITNIISHVGKRVDYESLCGGRECCMNVSGADVVACWLPLQIRTFPVHTLAFLLFSALVEHDVVLYVHLHARMHHSALAGGNARRYAQCLIHPSVCSWLAARRAWHSPHDHQRRCCLEQVARFYHRDAARALLTQTHSRVRTARSRGNLGGELLCSRACGWVLAHALPTTRIIL